MSLTESKVRTMFQHLGIPTHKHNLMLYRDVYHLDKSYHNFFIIFTHDIRITVLTSEYRNGFLTRNVYFREIREHYSWGYNLRYGNQLKNLLKQSIKRGIVHFPFFLLYNIDIHKRKVLKI